ncbi:MAG: MerR family transcriptional regulator [Allorhizobium sp.]
MRRDKAEKQVEFIGLAETLSRSGVSKVLLHAWERRYGMAPAERSPTGRRFYTRDQVERLRLLKSLSDNGHRIGSLVALSTDSLTWMEQALHARDALKEIVEAIKAMDSDRLQALLQARAKLETPEHFIRATVLPLMRELGSLWTAGEITIAAEHMTTAKIKRILGRLFDQCPTPSENAPRLIATTPEREEHDVGALVVTLLARSRGWSALFLGASLPAAEIVEAAHRRNVVCVCLSALTGRKAALERHLRDLRSALSPDIEIWTGGAGYGPLSALPGITFMPSLDAFLESLDRWAQA